MSSCQTFRDTLAQSKIGELNALLEKYMESPQTFERSYTQKVKEIQEERARFIEIYQQKVRELFAKWYPSEDQAEKDEFLKQLTFDPESQKVIITPSFELSQIYDYEYFPSLIKGVEGDIHLPRGLKSPVDELEYVTGTLFIREETNLKTMRKLKRVGQRLFISETNVFLESLEEVGDEIIDSNYKQNTIPKLRRVGGRLDLPDEITSLDSLEEVGSHLTADNNLESLPKLRTVGGALALMRCKLQSLPSLEWVEYAVDITDVPALLPQTDPDGNTIPPKVTMAEFFPKLIHVGEDSSYISFRVATEEQRRQLLELKRQGKISFPGDILVKR